MILLTTFVLLSFTAVSIVLLWLTIGRRVNFDVDVFTLLLFTEVTLPIGIFSLTHLSNPRNGAMWLCDNLLRLELEQMTVSANGLALGL